MFFHFWLINVEQFYVFQTFLKKYYIFNIFNVFNSRRLKKGMTKQLALKTDSLLKVAYFFSTGLAAIKGPFLAEIGI